MSIQQEIILRHKSSGHVRFQIPECLCNPEVAPTVSGAIANINGVYRVNLFRNKKKLSIRYVEENLSFSELAEQLISLLSELESKDIFKEKPLKVHNLKASIKLSDWKGINWAKDKYTETIRKQYMTQQTIVTSQPNDGQGDPLRTAFEKVNNNFDELYLTGIPNSNIQIFENIIKSIDLDGDITLAPNGSGGIVLAGTTTTDILNTATLNSNSALISQAVIPSLNAETLSVEFLNINNSYSPATPKGAANDSAGDVSWSTGTGSYFYVCIKDFTDGVDDIWLRTELTAW